MPLALRRLAPPGGRILVLGERLRLGRDPELEVVLEDGRVRHLHARLRPMKGEWVVAAEGSAPLWVNGRPVPFFNLRHGDRIDLCDPAGPRPVGLVLEDRMAGTFVPPGVSRLTAWLAHPASRAEGAGPERYGVEASALPPAGGAFPGRLPDLGEACLVEVGPPEAGALACERALEGAVSVAGAPHACLAAVLDAGALPGPSGPRPWIVTRPTAGRSASELLAGPPLGLGPWLRAMAQAARGLAWVHRRGCLLRRLAPERLVLTPDGGAVLGGYLEARLWRHGIVPAVGDAGALGLLAPEEGVEGGPAITAAVDVHGLCAVGYALLVGGWGGERAERFATGARQGRPPPRLRDLGVEVPFDLEQALLEGLARQPADRPNAADLARRFEGLTAVWGMELA